MHHAWTPLLHQGLQARANSLPDLLDDHGPAHVYGHLDGFPELGIRLPGGREGASGFVLALEPGDSLHLRVYQQAEPLRLLDDQRIVDGHVIVEPRV